MGININQMCEQGLVECLQAICASRYRDSQGNPVGEFNNTQWQNEFQYVEEQYSIQTAASKAMDFYTEMVTGSFKTPEDKLLDVANKNKRAANTLIDRNPSLCTPPKTGSRVPSLSSLPNYLLEGKNEFSMLLDSVLTTQLSPIPSHVWYKNIVKWSDDFFVGAKKTFSNTGMMIRDNVAIFLMSVAGLGIVVGEGLKGAGEPRAVFFGNVIEGTSGLVVLLGAFVAGSNLSIDGTNLCPTNCVSTNDPSSCQTNCDHTNL